MNFLGEFKGNLNFFKTKLLNVFKKLNYLIIIDVLILIFCVLLLLNCNCLNTFFNFFVLNVLLTNNSLLFILLFILSINNLLINKIYYKSNNFNSKN